MSLKEYMELPYSMSIIPDTVEGGFTVIFPELPGCMTCGDTIEEAVEMAMDAKKCWLEDAIEMGQKNTFAVTRKRFKIKKGFIRIKIYPVYSKYSEISDDYMKK